MERKEAISKLKRIEGIELHNLAEKNQVTIRTAEGRVNKGWAGHTIERFLGLPLNSSQSPNFGSWELKVVPIKELRSGVWTIKETMAITMIDPINVVKTAFENSHLLMKLQKIVMVVRSVGSDVDEDSFIREVTTIDLSNKRIYDQVKNDYNLVRDTLKGHKNGFNMLTGRMGIYIQPRTKGAGHGSQSRAFYARKEFLNLFMTSLRGNK
jgi:DNA mismatch repair protein MutH